MFLNTTYSYFEGPTRETRFVTQACGWAIWGEGYRPITKHLVDHYLKTNMSFKLKGVLCDIKPGV